MKTTIKFVGIITFIAVIGFSMAACGDDSSAGKLEGFWDSGSLRIRISGSNAYFENISGSNWEFTTVLIGEQYLKDIKQTGDLRWSAKVRLDNGRTSPSNQFSNGTITMRSDMRSFEVYCAVAASRYTTFTKRN